MERVPGFVARWMRRKGRGPSICHVMDEEKRKGSEHLSRDG